MFTIDKQAVAIHLLSIQPMYGLELVKESGGNLKRGTVYVLLHRLENENIVESRKQPSGRRVYRLTRKGKRLKAANVELKRLDSLSSAAWC